MTTERTCTAWWTSCPTEPTTTLRIVETQRHDPMLQALANAPEDDEPWTDEDEAAVAESRSNFAAGRTRSHEKMLQKYG